MAAVEAKSIVILQVTAYQSLPGFAHIPLLSITWKLSVTMMDQFDSDQRKRGESRTSFQWIMEDKPTHWLFWVRFEKSLLESKVDPFVSACFGVRVCVLSVSDGLSFEVLLSRIRDWTGRYQQNSSNWRRDVYNRTPRKLSNLFCDHRLFPCLPSYLALHGLLRWPCVLEEHDFHLG